MINSYISFWKKSFDFKGVSSRKDFWMGAVLPNTIVSIVLVIIALIASLINEYLGLFFWVIYILFGLGSMIPSIAISIRRIRDIGKEWYWIFINFAPCVGGFWFIYLMCQPSIPIA